MYVWKDKGLQGREGEWKGERREEVMRIDRIGGGLTELGRAMIFGLCRIVWGGGRREDPIGSVCLLSSHMLPKYYLP